MLICCSYSDIHTGFLDSIVNVLGFRELVGQNKLVKCRLVVFLKLKHTLREQRWKRRCDIRFETGSCRVHNVCEVVV